MTAINFPFDGARWTTLRRVLRCLTVSAGTTALSVMVLLTLALGAGVPAGVANVIGVCCGIPVSYWANRRWVWQRRGASNTMREIVPFWTMSLVGLVASTAAVDRVASATAALPSTWRGALLPVANVATFGVLWVFQYLLLDRVIFRRIGTPDAPTRFSSDLETNPVARTHPRRRAA